VLRLKACALREAGDAKQAEALFQEALTIARGQSARSFELRGALGYARLLRDQGRFDEAINILQPVYDWFTEGHKTSDLQEAAALLLELGSRDSRPAFDASRIASENSLT